MEKRLTVLVVDDDQIRHDIFDRKYYGHDIVHARTVERAVELMRCNKFDVVQLDHDLGDSGVREILGVKRNCELTGQDVARAIAWDIPRERVPDRIVVHSMNPVGAQRIKEILWDAEIPSVYEPFMGLSSGS